MVDGTLEEVTAIDGGAAYIDRATVRQSEGIRRVRQVISYDKPRPEGWSSVVQLMLFRCLGRESDFVVLEEEYFTAPLGKGAKLSPAPKGATLNKVFNVRQGSVGEASLVAVCSQKGWPDDPEVRKKYIAVENAGLDALRELNAKRQQACRQELDQRFLSSAIDKYTNRRVEERYVLYSANSVGNVPKYGNNYVHKVTLQTGTFLDGQDTGKRGVRMVLDCVTHATTGAYIGLEISR